MATPTHLKNFNLMYHGSMRDVNDALEAGIELNAQETGALLSNITRRLADLEEKKEQS